MFDAKNMQTAHHFDRFLHFDSVEFDLNRITKLVSFTCQSKQTPSILISGKKTEQNRNLKVVKSLLNSVAIDKYLNFGSQTNAMHFFGLIRVETKRGISMQYKLFRK